MLVLCFLEGIATQMNDLKSTSISTYGKSWDTIGLKYAFKALTHGD